MLIGYFKRSKTQGVFLLPFVVVVLWVFPFMDPEATQAQHAMPFYELLLYFVGDLPIILHIIALLLVVFEAFLVNRITVGQEILNTSTYLPGAMYAVFMSCCPQLTDVHPVLFANLFILLAIRRLFNMHRKEYVFSEVFDASFYISIATLFYVPSFVFLPLIWVSLIVIRPFVWREWIISLIGFVVPYLFVCMYFYWIDKFDYLWYDKLFYPLSINKIDLNWPVTYYFLFAVMFFISFVSLTKVFRGVTINTVRAKNNIIILFWLCGLALLSIVIAPLFSIQYFAFLAIPCSIFSANYFLSIKRTWFAELLFTLLIISIVLTQLVDINL